MSLIIQFIPRERAPTRGTSCSFFYFYADNEAGRAAGDSDLIASPEKSVALLAGAGAFSAFFYRHQSRAGAPPGENMILTDRGIVRHSRDSKNVPRDTFPRRERRERKKTPGQRRR